MNDVTFLKHFHVLAFQILSSFQSKNYPSIAKLVHAVTIFSDQIFSSSVKCPSRHSLYFDIIAEVSDVMHSVVRLRVHLKTS